MKNQKFKRGNLVRIAKDLGDYMKHFESDCDAIVCGSYADQYGGEDTTSYTLMLLPSLNRTSWYYEHQLTLLEEGGEHLITEAEKKIEQINNKESNLVWIKNNWSEFMKEPNSAGVQRLANYLGCFNLWGSHGEGIVYDQNLMFTINIFDKEIIPKLTGEDETSIDIEIRDIIENLIKEIEAK